jgi:2-polyprenyl-6-methoxyphenol hydroxylase-like FAD-dependent oxidoreductase
MSEARECDVLVVGAGPTGLTLASELLRRGVSCRVVDQLAEPVVYSKAAVVHARTMELFDAMGVAAAMIERSRVQQGTSVYSGGKRVAHIVMQGELESAYPQMYGISQHDTEEVLRAHLAKVGGALERGVKLEGFAQDEQGVRATLAHADGTREEARARWIVGCDGAHSTVRKTLEIPFHGAPYEEKLIQTDVRVAFARDVDDDEVLLFLHERGPAAFFPLFRDGRYRLILIDMGASTPTPAAAGGAAPPEPALDDFRAGLAARGVEATLSDPAWSVAFRIHHRHVEKLRERRAFLAGDAAHIHSPVGGQGMNTGIQDAFNLAWKLALVARGRARAELLDSYEPERLPVIRALIEGTDRATRGMESMVTLRHPVAVALRNQLMSVVTRLGAVQSQAAHTISMLGVGYEASPICAQDRPALWQASLLGSDGSEDPSVRDWAAFGGGPAPGSRAPDVAAQGGVEGGGAPARVHELLRAGAHVALLFDGAAATEAGYRNLTGIAQRLRARYGDAVAPHLVVPFASAPAAARWDGPTLRDGGGDVHKRYGARSECVYVVRPDGYVGYRAQPADGEKLQAWFDRFLAART